MLLLSKLHRVTFPKGLNCAIICRKDLIANVTHMYRFTRKSCDIPDFNRSYSLKHRLLFAFCLMIISANFYFQLFTLTFCKPQIYFELLRIENNYGKFEMNKRNLQRNLRKRHLVKIMQTYKIVPRKWVIFLQSECLT